MLANLEASYSSLAAAVTASVHYMPIVGVASNVDIGWTPIFVVGLAKTLTCTNTLLV